MPWEQKIYTFIKSSTKDQAPGIARIICTLLHNIIDDWFPCESVDDFIAALRDADSVDDDENYAVAVQVADFLQKLYRKHPRAFDGPVYGCLMRLIAFYINHCYTNEIDVAILETDTAPLLPCITIVSLFILTNRVPGNKLFERDVKLYLFGQQDKQLVKDIQSTMGTIGISNIRVPTAAATLPVKDCMIWVYCQRSNEALLSLKKWYLKAGLKMVVIVLVYDIQKGVEAIAKPEVVCLEATRIMDVLEPYRAPYTKEIHDRDRDQPVIRVQTYRLEPGTHQHFSRSRPRLILKKPEPEPEPTGCSKRISGKEMLNHSLFF